MYLHKIVDEIILYIIFFVSIYLHDEVVIIILTRFFEQSKRKASLSCVFVSRENKILNIYLHKINIITVMFDCYNYYYVIIKYSPKYIIFVFYRPAVFDYIHNIIYNDTIKLKLINIIAKIQIY